MSGATILSQEYRNTSSNLSSAAVYGLTTPQPYQPYNNNNLTIPQGCVVLTQSAISNFPWDNPDNIISRDVEKAVEKAIGTICLPALFLISVPCNLLNMLVFGKQGLKERINLCLFYLSLVDFLHMLNMFFVHLDKIFPLSSQQQQGGLGPVQEFIINHRLVGLDGFNWLSGFASMVIACERCLCVVTPLKSQTILKTRTTGVLLILATLGIMTCAMVRGTRRGLACMYNPLTRTTFTIIATSRFYAQNKAYLDILTFFLATIQPCIYVVVVCATTIVTSVKLTEMIAWRRQQQTSSSGRDLTSREVALTRMLIAISVVYLLCSVPTMMLGMTVVLVPGFSLNQRYYNLYRTLLNVARLASYLNATLNFCVYCLVGSKFRDTLRQLFPCSSVRSVSAEK